MTKIKSVKTHFGALVLSAAALASPQKAEAQAYYVGEIITVGYTFCPRGTVSLEGQILSINDNIALFSLLGTNYGGNGQTSYGIPRARGRSLLGQGSGPGLEIYQMGDLGGSETQTMTLATMPSHNHLVRATNSDGNKPGPGGKLLAAAPDGGVGAETIYSTQDPTVQMSASMISNAGGQQSFNIRDPYLGLRFCVVTSGIYPSRN
jgi:microcystin-dependent protein